MSAPGFWEIVFLAVLALLVFGPDKLPEIARTVGKVIGTLKREATSTLDELKQSADFSEINEVRGELQSMGQELRQATDVRHVLEDAVADEVRPPATRAAAEIPARTEPAPFDPDAT
jgi:Tat protein translocase TatB subunit